MKRTQRPGLIVFGRWPTESYPRLPATPRTGQIESGWEPPADVYLEEGAVVIQIELAGLRPEDLELTSEGRLLIVRGERPRRSDVTLGAYRQAEINYGPFQRLFEFPFLLSDAELEASMVEGFLTVRVRPAQDTKRRIDINTEG